LLQSLLPRWIPTPQRRREARAIRDINEIVYGLIQKRRAADSADLGDLLSMLLLTQDDEGSGMNNKQVRDEVVTILIAGHETTANALNWASYLLAQNPEVETKLHQELDEVLEGMPPTLEDLKRLPYTEMVIKESMRMYPPAYYVGRVAIEDTTIGGYNVPKGTNIGLFIYFAHRDPRWWDQPEAFIPERFSPEHGQHLDRSAYLPFGAGPRICIGNNFAMMEAQIMLAMIAQRYRLRLTSGQQVVPETLVTLRPRGGLRMTVHQRQPEPALKNAPSHH
jgi:cytochrome P450